MHEVLRNARSFSLNLWCKAGQMNQFNKYCQSLINIISGCDRIAEYWYGLPSPGSILCQPHPVIQSSPERFALGVDLAKPDDFERKFPLDFVWANRLPTNRQVSCMPHDKQKRSPFSRPEVFGSTRIFPDEPSGWTYKWVGAQQRAFHKRISNRYNRGLQACFAPVWILCEHFEYYE